MFRIIGSYEIKREGDLIHVWSSPEFNLEAAQQYALDMMAIIEEMPARFATLVEFEAPPIIAPEVEDSMHASAIARGERGLVAVAFVMRSLDGIAVARGQWQRIYRDTGIVFDTFADIEAARAWLEEKMGSGPIPPN
jgi:hypothetical protein